MDVLLIEDDGFKAKKIRASIVEQFPSSSLRVARSVSSGLSLLFSCTPSVLLLDMSLSTFDVGPRETGGRPQNFGGVAVLDHMIRRGVSVPVILITQFETFPRDGRALSLGDLRNEMRTRYPQLFRALIYYNSRETTWQGELAEVLAQLDGITER